LSGERRINLDGNDRGARGGELLGHFAVACADFYPAIMGGFVSKRSTDGLRRNPDGLRDLFAPTGVSEEMLAEALSSHSETV
jgi:hypothetical protein